MDHLIASKTHHYALHWLLCDGDFGSQGLANENRILVEPLDGEPSDSRILIQTGLREGGGNFSIVRADPDTTRGWRSEYYGHKEPAVSLMLEADLPKACFWSYFGWEGDTVEQSGDSLHIRSRSWQTTIPLDK